MLLRKSNEAATELVYQLNAAQSNVILHHSDIPASTNLVLRNSYRYCFISHFYTTVLPWYLGNLECTPKPLNKGVNVKFGRLDDIRKFLYHGMRHLTYGTNFLHLFAFLVSQPPQSALLHCQALTLLLNWWLACLTGSSILVLKLTFSPDPFPVTFLSL